MNMEDFGGPKTPQRIYSVNDVCCLCCFSFVVKEIDERGNSVVKKLHKLKLKLTDEKKTIVSQVVELPPQATGICVRCFAKVEKVIKYRNEIDNIISSFEESRRRLLSKSPRSVKKRGLRSPEVS